MHQEQAAEAAAQSMGMPLSAYRQHVNSLRQGSFATIDLLREKALSLRFELLRRATVQAVHKDPCC